MEENKKKKQSLRPFGQGFPWQMIVFLSVLVLVGVCSLILEKPTFSQIEKRELAKMPSPTLSGWFDGSLPRDTDAFYADTFPLRDVLVSLSNNVKESLGLRLGDVRIIGGAQAPVDPEAVTSQGASSQPDQTADSASSQDASSVAESQPVVEEDGVGENKNGIFIYKGRGMSIFGGGEATGRTYAANINAYHEVFGDSVRIFDMVVPTSVEFYLPKKYASLSASQKDGIDNIYNHLADGVVGVDAHSALSAHAGEYLYFNTDHHWTGRGAYYAYTAFAKAAGFAPLDIEKDYDIRVIPNFLGSLYSQTQDSQMREKGDYVEYFVPDVAAKASMLTKDQPYKKYAAKVWAEEMKGGNAYLVFLSGDLPMVQIDTGVKNGKSIVVVKESYGNAFAPFLIPHYEHIYVVDERYFQTSLVNFIKENKVNDLLFVNNIFSAVHPYHAGNVQKLMYQQFVPTPPPEASSSVAESSSSSTDDKFQGIFDHDDQADEE